jgi:hypothetical protein
MKRSILFVALAFICSTGFTLAGPLASTTPIVSSPQVHQINLRLHEQWKLIQAGVKAGKITQIQAATLREDLKSVRQQETAFFKQNGNRSLTTDQQSQLNQALNKNSAALGETPVN